jgi:hypothetical protein
MLHENDPDPNDNPGRRKNKARYEMHARMINTMPASRKGNCGAIPQIRRRGSPVRGVGRDFYHFYF